MSVLKILFNFFQLRILEGQKYNFWFNKNNAF